jgi:predicted TIM-barrel fold metal-dependent hydrolase
MEAPMREHPSYPIFDADNHYYEALDCCTRHIEPRYRGKAVRFDQHEGRDAIFVGDKLYTYGAVHVDHCPTPGTLVQMMRSWKSGGFDGNQSEMDQPIQPEYRDRDKRLALLDQQGIEACIMLPTLGVTLEHFMKDDPEQTYANLSAFNKWLEDDWGYAYQDRIFAAPLMSLLDLDLALAELDRVRAAGARAIHLRPGPQQGRSPADLRFDPFWARLDEAKVPVLFHTSEFGYNELYSVAWGEAPNPSCYEQSAWQWLNCFGDRAIIETLSALIYHNLFGRFPNLHVASIEHGSGWVDYLLGAIDKKKGMARNGPWPGGRLERRPSDVFKEHVYLTPFPEDDVPGLIDLVGPGQVLCGSDYPHAEGLAEPRRFFDLLPESLSEAEVRGIMRDNSRRLLGLQ